MKEIPHFAHNSYAVAQECNRTMPKGGSTKAYNERTKHIQQACETYALQLHSSNEAFIKTLCYLAEQLRQKDESLKELRIPQGAKP